MNLKPLKLVNNTKIAPIVFSVKSAKVKCKLWDRHIPVVFGGGVYDKEDMEHYRCSQI